MNITMPEKYNRKIYLRDFQGGLFELAEKIYLAPKEWVVGLKPKTSIGCQAVIYLEQDTVIEMNLMCQITPVDGELIIEYHKYSNTTTE